MPTYTFKNKDTGEVFDKIMKIADKPDYLRNNPNIVSVVTAPEFVGDHIIQRTDAGMKEVFSRIADKHPSTPLADRFGDSRTSKQVKTEQIAKKYGLKKN